MSSRHHELNHAHLCFSLIFAVFEIIMVLQQTQEMLESAGNCQDLTE